jgi:cytochrome P450
LAVLATSLRGDLLKPFVRLFENYGPLYRIRLPLGHNLIVLAHPAAVEHVLRSRQENYVKGSVYDGARLLLGKGLVTSEGDLWRRQRALANPAFRPSRLERYLATMAECTRQLIVSWKSGGDHASVDAQEEMTRLTMSIVGQTLFGMDLSHLSERARSGFDTALRSIGRRGPANLQVPLWLPTPGNIRFRKALGELDSIVYEIIGRFRSGEAVNADRTLLGAYVAARDPDTGEGMSDRQLRDEIITLYLAGHETTASLLTWSLYWLARRPDIAERVSAEIDGQAWGGTPNPEQLKRLQYTSRFISEVLRLYPPAWTIARNSVEEDVILGYHIPANAIVMLSPYLAHRWPEVWPEPLRFDPDRFAPDIVKDRHPFAYFPFSLGSRICIGMQFALLEARLVLSLILRSYRVASLDRAEVGCIATGTLRPDGPIRIRLVPRAGGR